MFYILTRVTFIMLKEAIQKQRGLKRRAKTVKNKDNNGAIEHKPKCIQKIRKITKQFM